MVELIGISLLSPIVKKGVKAFSKWYEKRRDMKKQANMTAKAVKEMIEAQKEVDIKVKGPVYGGTSNHWIENLTAATQGEDVNYSYLGNQVESRMEVNKKLTVLKLELPNINKDLLREAIMKDQWKIQNDKKHGNGVFTMAIPQEVSGKVEDEVVTFTAEGLGSVPINGRYMFNKEVKGLQINTRDPNPEDFYRAGGKLEIPIEVTDEGYSIFPVAPPPPKIPDYAMKVVHFSEDVIRPVQAAVTAQPFIFCPLCGAKNMTGGTPAKFCMSCGKNIEKFMS